MMSRASESSPFKSLAANLNDFHISSPGRQGSRQTVATASASASARDGDNTEYEDQVTQTTMATSADADGDTTSEKRNSKQYVPNKEFSDSKFVSRLAEEDSGVVKGPGTKKSYMDKLGDWSFEYGTVQHRSNKENDVIPQWRQYMQKQEPRDPPSELVVTTSFSDISGFAINTFKNYSKNGYDNRSAGNRVKDEEILHPQLQGHEEEDEDEEDDPVKEAHGVFANILKAQKSNYEIRSAKNDMQLLAQSAVSDSEIHEVSDTSEPTDSFIGESPERIVSPYKRNKYDDIKPPSNKIVENLKRKESSKNIKGLQLITPESVGFVFNHANGVWDKPPAQHQDISSSHTVDNNTTTFNNNSNMRIDEMDDTAPIDSPRIDSQKFRKLPKNILGTDTSFAQSKKELVSVLTEVLTNETNWDKARTVSLKECRLQSVMGLSELLPNLMNCQLEKNMLTNLEGLPEGVMTLDASYNKISTNFLGSSEFEKLVHLVKLNLSYNGINFNDLKFIPLTLKHLQEVNLSGNRIRSLDGLVTFSHLKKLNLSRNEISGIIDFQKLVQRNKKHGVEVWSQIEELDLTDNNIACVKNLSYLTNLRIIKLDRNPIKYILEEDSDEAGPCCLQTLSVTKTNGALVRIQGRKYTNLRILRIDRIESIVDRYTYLPLLEELKVYGGDMNKLYDWEISYGLRRLYLYDMKNIKTFQMDKHFPILQELKISYTSNRHGEGITSLYNLIQDIPNLCLSALDITGNPVVEAIGDDDGGDDTMAMIENALLTACPNLRQLKLR